MVNRHATTTKPHRAARWLLAAAVVVVSVGALVVWTRNPDTTDRGLALPVYSTDDVERAVESLDPDLACTSEDLRAGLQFVRVSCIESTHARDVATVGSSTFESNDLLVLGCVPGITVQVYDRDVTSDASLIPVWRAAINKEWPTCPNGGTGRLRQWANGNVRMTSTSPALDATALSLLGEAPTEIGQKAGSSGTPSQSVPTEEPVPSTSSSGVGGLSSCPPNEQVATDADATYYSPPIVLIRGACVSPDGRTTYLRYDGVGPGKASPGCLQITWLEVGDDDTAFKACPFNAAPTVRLTPVADEITVSHRSAAPDEPDLLMPLSAFLAKYATTICSTPQCRLPGGKGPLVLLETSYSGPGSPNVMWTGGQVTAVEVQTATGRANDASLPGIGNCYWPTSGDVIVKPTETAIGCNGTLLLEDLQWDSWDSQRAEGVGVINEVDLRPGDSNASAPRKRSSVKIVADTPVTVACGLFFSRLEVTYLSGDRNGQVEVLDDMAPSDLNCD